LGSRDVTVSEAAVSRPPIWVRFWRDRRGAVAVAVAVLLPVLVGFAGIGVEVGLWFAIQRQNQSAADAAAISAALEYAAQIERGVAIDSTAATAAATTAANCNLFSTSSSSSNAVCPLPSSASNTLTLYPCYNFSVGGLCNTLASNGALPNAVQVALTQPLNTAFANFVTAIWGPNINSVKVTTTAIAEFPQTSTSTACILSLDQTAVIAVNNGTLSNPDCWVASNSSSGSALSCNNCAIAGPTSVVGGDVVPNNGPPNRTYASTVADPYAATLTHAFLTAGMPGKPCKQTYGGNCAFTAPPALPGTINLAAWTQIVRGLSFTGIVNLSPGPYWITDGSLQLSGTLQCPSCSPGGAGVTIIFTTMQGSAGTIGTLSPSGDLTITLNAPGVGRPYAGLLMAQDAVVTPTPGDPIGNPRATLSGLIYFPKANLSFVGHIQTDSSNCLVAVADSFSLTGDIRLDGSGCPAAGLTTVPTILSVFLADNHG
jgi:Flp pilus assembly protein TadG